MQQYPIVFENFFSDSECKTLLELATDNEELFEMTACPIPRWDKRNIHAYMLQKDHKTEHTVLLEVAGRI